MHVLDYLIYPIAFLITVTLITVLRPVARDWGLMDHPGGRKSHVGVVPAVGGIAIFGGICVAALLSSDYAALATVAAISAILVVVGLFDDIHGLSPRHKLGAQIVAAFLMVAVADVHIESLGFLTTHSVTLSGNVSVAFTIFGVVGLVNAVNMIDGMDGLAGGVAAVALSFFALAAFVGGSDAGLQLALLTISAVLGFLVFNARIGKPRAHIFMGDAGSLLLGFVLAWLAVSLSQGPYRDITPMAAVWIMGVPLLDALTVMLQRVLSGKSPFAADRGHMHHILLDHGLSVNQTLAVILAVGALFGAIGLGSVYLAFPEKWMLLAALSVFAVYFVATLFAKRELEQGALHADAFQAANELEEQHSRAA